MLESSPATSHLDINTCWMSGENEQLVLIENSLINPSLERLITPAPKLPPYQAGFIMRAFKLYHKLEAIDISCQIKLKLL